MKQNLKKLIVFALSSMLAVGSPISASAEEVGQNDAAGAGQTERLVRPEVYQVVLPTDVNGIFDFILDPQKLIEETNAAAYGGTSFEKGATMFFRRSDGQTAEEYSSSSDHVTIVNRSNVPVEVQVDVNVLPDSLGGIVMTGDREFTGDDGTSLYIALTDGQYTVPVRTEGSYIRTTIPAAPEEAFEYRYDQEHGQYIYGLKSDLSNVQFPEYSFQLTGAVNEKGDWKALGKVSPMVNVTWRVTPVHSLDSGDGNNPEQDNLEQDMAPEQSMIMKQILETIPVENGDEDGDLKQKEDSSQSGDSEQSMDLGQSEDSEQSMDSDQDKDSEQNKPQEESETSNQKRNSDQSEDSGRKEETDQDKNSEQNGTVNQNEE